MSNRERIIQLLDNVPDYKIGYVLAYVQGIIAGENDIARLETEMIADDPNAKTYTNFKEFMREMELENE